MTTSQIEIDGIRWRSSTPSGWVSSAITWV